MNQKCRSAFLGLVLVQALHSVEEYAFRFYEVFPPARFLNDTWPGVTQPGFIIFNAALVSFGLWCFFARVGPGAATARAWAWVWVVIELYNGVGHPIWALLAGAYNPGLASSPLLLVIAAYLAICLRASGRPQMHPRSSPTSPTRPRARASFTRGEDPARDPERCGARGVGCGGGGPAQ